MVGFRVKFVKTGFSMGLKCESPQEQQYRCVCVCVCVCVCETWGWGRLRVDSSSEFP